MTTGKFNDHDTTEKALILMAVGDNAVQEAIHESYNDYNNKGIITFDEWRAKILNLWADNFPKVLWYDIREFIDKVLYHEDVPERCEELPIKIYIGDRYLEIPMDAVTQGALEVALEHFSRSVNDNYEP